MDIWPIGQAFKRPAGDDVPKARESSYRTRIGVAIRAEEPWRRWLKGLARHLKAPTATLVENALAMYAREIGYPDPPRRSHPKGRRPPEAEE